MRSASRKRGSRGQGGKLRHKEQDVAKKKQAAAKAPAPPVPIFPPSLPMQPAQSAAPPVQPVGMMPAHMRGPMTPQTPPVKRKRERKNRVWKPWSEQTWEERLEREKYQERRAAEREAQETLPLVRLNSCRCQSLWGARQAVATDMCLAQWAFAAPFRARARKRSVEMSCRYRAHPATPRRR